MIIAFWSNIHGQPKTTSNMVALATEMACGLNRSCILTHTHFNLNNLESYLIESLEDRKEVLFDIGLDGLSRIIKLRAIDKATIENYSIPLIHKNLTLLPGTTADNRKVFVNDIGKAISILLNEINKYYEMVFVDVNSGSDEVSKLILEKADIIVINLCQNKKVLDNYKALGSLKGKKIMYLFGSYDRDSSYNLHNLKLMYKFLYKAKIGVIPYNIGFMDAQSDGSILKFMKKNRAVKKNAINGYFMECVKDAAMKLLKLAENQKGGAVI